MSWLQDELPATVVQVLQQVRQNSSSNATSASFPQPSSTDANAIWPTIASQYALTSIWSLALVLSFIALNILAILLLLTWRLAKASLSLSDVHKFIYSSSSPGRKIRKLRLPGNGAVLGLLLCASTAQVVEVVRWGSWGRISWLDSVGESARTVAFICIWLSVFFVSIASIQSIPLLSHTSSLSLPVPRSFDLPILHPILVDFLVLVLPFLLCIIPAFIFLINSNTSINTFDALLMNAQSASNDTILSVPSVIHDGFDKILTSWQIQGYGRTIAFLVLLIVVLAIEMRAHSRLGKIASFLREAEAVSLSSSTQEDYHTDEKPITTLSRAYSIASGLSGYRSHYSRKRPNLLEVDLPSPSLMKDNAEYAYPVLDYREGASEYSTSDYGEKPQGPRRMMSYPTPDGNQAYMEAEQHNLPYYPVSRPRTPVRSVSRQSLQLPMMIRSRTYGSSASHSSRHSCSCGSSASVLSSYKFFGRREKHFAGPYDGPSSMHIVQQKKTRLVDAGVMISLLGLACLIEGLGSLLKRVTLQDRRLEASFQSTALLVQILPTLGGLLLSAIRNEGAAYGWAKEDDDRSESDYAY